MPLSEFLRLAIEKLEASKKKSCSADLSVSGMENNLVEVVWEDGPTHHNLTPTTPSVRDAMTTECLGGVDSIFDDMSPVVASGELELSQNYGVDDGLQDYFSEVSGVKAKETSGSKTSSCDQAIRHLDNGQDAYKFSSFKACSSLRSWPPPQGQKSRFSGISSINRQDVMYGSGAQSRDVVSDSSSMKMGSRDLLSLSGGISSSGFKRMGVKETDLACRCSNPIKSMLIQRSTSERKDIDLYVPSTPTMVNSAQLSINEHKEKDFCQDTCRKTSKALTQNTVVDGERSVEPVFASSSLGSGNSGDRVSYVETHNLKRKNCDIESECHSDDIQKPTAARDDGGTGAKKSRTAQVHNLSERRRRDRINDKMRALQELIPNCNKADKASMLDDVIQYLKNLQHQVQVYKTMSMGAGLCVPPMMFASGSQHMYPAPIPHYSSMGVGMRMSMSYPIFPVHANFQGTPALNLPIHGHQCPGFHSRPPSIPSTGAHHSSLGIPTKSTSSQSPHNAEGSCPINRAKNQ
ncbi:hypothetical protein ACS0TY_003012 [Phlomoides rotata]